MRRNIFLFLIAGLAVLAVPHALVQAKQEGQGGTTQSQTQVQTQTQSTVEETVPEPIQSQHETQTSNQGSESQVQAKPDYQPIEAAEKIAETGSLLGVESAYGQQLHNELNAHQQRQQLAQELVEALDERTGWKRRLLGPNYQELKKIETIIEENTLQIRALRNYQNQVVNEGEISALQELVGALEAENTSLQQRVDEEKSQPGFFGWLFNLFTF